MKRILAFILIAIASYVSMVVGKLQDHPLWLYLGMVIAGMLALGLAVWLVRLTAKFIGWAMTSVLYLVAALGVVGLLSWHSIIPAFAGYSTAIVLSGALCLVFVRRLARWAQKSLIGGEVFSFVSSYQLRNFIQKDRLVDKETAINFNVEVKNLVVVLKSLGYSTTEAKEASTHVLAQAPANLAFDDKIREALKYLGGQPTVEVYRN